MKKLRYHSYLPINFIILGQFTLLQKFTTRKHEIRTAEHTIVTYVVSLYVFKTETIHYVGVSFFYTIYGLLSALNN